MMKWISRAALAGALLGAIAMTACGGGGDDDDDTGGAGSAATSAPTDESKVSTSGTSAATTAATTAAQPTATTKPADVKATGTDKDYVKSICMTFDTFADALAAEIAKDPSLFNDEAKFFKTIAPVMEKLANEIEKANPPSDLKTFHEAMLKQNKQMVADIKAGKITTITDFTSRVQTQEQPPASAQARLAAAAQTTPECTMVPFLFAQ